MTTHHIHPTLIEAVEGFRPIDMNPGKGTYPVLLHELMARRGTTNPLKTLASLLRAMQSTGDRNLIMKARDNLLLGTVYLLHGNKAVGDLSVPMTNLNCPFTPNQELNRLGRESLDHRLTISNEYLSPKTAKLVTTMLEWDPNPDVFQCREVPIEKPYWTTDCRYCTLPATIIGEMEFLARLVIPLRSETEDALSRLRPYVIQGWVNLRRRCHPKDEEDAVKYGALLIDEKGMKVGEHPLPDSDPDYVAPPVMLPPAPVVHPHLSMLLDGHTHKEVETPVGKFIIAANPTHARVIHYKLARGVRVGLRARMVNMFASKDSHMTESAKGLAGYMDIPADRQGFRDVNVDIPTTRKAEESVVLDYKILDGETTLAQGMVRMADSEVIQDADRAAEIWLSDQAEGPLNKNW